MMKEAHLNSYTIYLKILGFAQNLINGENTYAGCKYTVETPNTYTQQELHDKFCKTSFGKILGVDGSNIIFITKEEYERDYYE